MEKFNAKIAILLPDGQFYERKNRLPATYQDYYEYAQRVASTLRKEKKQYQITCIDETGKQRFQIKSKLFTN